MITNQTLEADDWLGGLLKLPAFTNIYNQGVYKIWEIKFQEISRRFPGDIFDFPGGLQIDK